MASLAQAVTVSLEDLQNGMKSLTSRHVHLLLISYFVQVVRAVQKRLNESMDSKAHSHNPTFTTRATFFFLNLNILVLYSYLPELP